MNLTDNELKAVAEDAVMTLEQHDRVYHDGNYQGGYCEYRKTRAKGDESDEALNEADHKEHAYFSALAEEKDAVNKAFKKMLTKGLKAKKGSTTVTVGDQRDDGTRDIHIWTDPNVDIGKFQSAAIPMLRTMGYSLREFEAIDMQDASDDRKIFALKIHNPNRTGAFAEQKQDAPVRIAQEEGDVSSGTLASLRSRYGIARGDDGSARGLTQEEKSEKSAGRRYLDLVNQGEFLFGGTREGQERERLFRAAEEENDTPDLTPEEVKEMLKWIGSQKKKRSSKKSDGAATTVSSDNERKIKEMSDKKARVEKAAQEFMALPFGQRAAAKAAWPEDIAKMIDARVKKLYLER